MRELFGRGIPGENLFINLLQDYEEIVISHPDESWDHMSSKISVANPEIVSTKVPFVHQRPIYYQVLLHYEVVNICTGDMGDREIVLQGCDKHFEKTWLPVVASNASGRKTADEIVEAGSMKRSCYNCTDYQAIGLRMRSWDHEKNGQDRR